MPEEMLSIRQIAQLLDIPEPTVLEWLEEGELQGYKQGDKWRVYRRDLENFIFRRDEVTWEGVNWRSV